MNKNQSEYDRSYAETEGVFGSGHEPMLERFLKACDERFPLLDMGAGQGRNSFYAARNGYRVVALEPSMMGANQIRETAVNQDLAIETIQAGFNGFSTDQTFSGIMVFGLIQILSPDHQARLLEFIDRHLQRGGLVFFTGFSTLDPSFSTFEGTWKVFAHNHFEKEGRYRFFLEPNQILNLLPYERLHHWEGLGPWHTHGDSKRERIRERHAMVEWVARKPKP